MTPKKAREILDSDDVVSIEEIAEAREVIAKLESKKKKSTNPRSSLLAHQQWLRRNKEITDLRNEAKKYWQSSTDSKIP